MVNSENIGVYRESLRRQGRYFSTWIIIMAKISSSLVSTGQFCTVTFTTATGEMRTVNGRTGVKKYIKGTGKRSEATDSKYLLLYTRNGSNKFDAPRNISRVNIISIKAHGIKADKNNNSAYAKTV